MYNETKAGCFLSVFAVALLAEGVDRNKKGMDGRYRYRIYIGKDEHGKPKYKNFYAATARDAKRAADAYRAAISNGMDPAQQKAALATLYRNLIAVKPPKASAKKALTATRTT